jgi:hypothetical protein
MEEKKYVNGLIIKEIIFDNGGTQLKASIAVKDLVEQLKQEDDNGWVNIVITRRKEPSDKGVTHYAYIDPWKPTPKAVGVSENKDAMMNGDANDFVF